MTSNNGKPEASIDASTVMYVDKSLLTETQAELAELKKTFDFRVQEKNDGLFTAWTEVERDNKKLKRELAEANLQNKELKFELEAKQRPLGEQVLELTLKLTSANAMIARLETALEYYARESSYLGGTRARNAIAALAEYRKGKL